MDALLGSSGDTKFAMEDQDLCIAIGEDLDRTYPGYLWMVGVDHQAGSIVIDLQVEKPPHLRNYGYRLNITSAFGPAGQKKVRDGAGELLERFGLRRGSAHPDTDEIAREHGLDISNNKDKSKGGSKV
jgi:hypothetical protein